MKKIFGLAVIFFITVFFSTNVLADAYRIKWGAQTPRIAMFTYVATLARYVNQALKGEVSIVPMETSGVLDNLVRVQRGLCQVGLTNNIGAYAMYKGILEFDGKPAQRFAGLPFATDR